MANATAPVTRQTVKTGEDKRVRGAASVAAYTRLYQGIHMGFKSTGYAEYADDTQKFWYAGVLDNQADIHLQSTDTAGVKRLMHDCPHGGSIRSLIDSTVSAADEGKAVYVKDTQTVTLTPGTYGNLAGWITMVPDTGSVFFRPVTNPRGGICQSQYRGVRTLAATGTEALTILDLNTIILVPNSAAKQVTLPAAANQVPGDRVMLIKSHASDTNAITVSGNSSNVDGAGTNTSMDAPSDSLELLWVNSTIGWLIVGGKIH